MKKHTMFLLISGLIGIFSSQIFAGAAPGSGDLSGDGKVDLADAILALKITAGINTLEQSIDAAADVNSDGRIGLAEVSYILQEAAGLRNVDTTPPSTPTLYRPSDLDVAYNFVKLLWSAATDRVGVAGYYVYRDTILAGQTTGVTFFDNDNIKPNMSYNYQIKAFDAAGNISNVSNVITVLTPGTPPSVDVSGHVGP